MDLDDSNGNHGEIQAPGCLEDVLRWMGRLFLAVIVIGAIVLIYRYYNR